MAKLSKLGARRTLGAWPVNAVPEWLANWRNGSAPAPKLATPPRVTPAPRPATEPRPDRLGFSEPDQWPDDGGKRREAVLDHDHSPPLVVRRVGWQRCLRCRKPFFSADVVGQCLCSGAWECRKRDDVHVF